MSAKANPVLLLTAGLLLAALAARSGALALMSLPFLAYLAAGLLSAPQAMRLRGARRLSRVRCEAGEPVTQTVTVQNDGPDLPCLRLCEPLAPPVRRLEGSPEQPLALPAGGSVELAYTFTVPRGHYTWPSIALSVSDPFGLFERRCELPAPARVLVQPAPLPLRRLPLRLAQTLRAVGPNLARLPGAGIDFWEVRAYHPGDALRWVDWRHSARHPEQLFTKEFEREEMANIGLILDARALPGEAPGDAELLERAIEAAAGLAKSLLQMGNRVSLLILGARIERVFPGTGKRQWMRILDRLAECAPGEANIFTALNYLSVRLFPARSTIVLVSPLQPGDFPSIARLRAEGYQVLLVCPDALNGAPSPGGNGTAALAVRAARLERTALLWRLRQIGVGVVDWPVDEPLTRHLSKRSHANPGGRR